MWGVLRGLGMVGVAICSLWLAGLIWFATPPADDPVAAPTDAIVVLTGGSLRLQTGIDLLREGKGQELFVSGVNQQVDLEDLLGSLLEFNRALPEIEIVAHPVFPDQVKRENWWIRRGTVSLLVTEYVKYL